MVIGDGRSLVVVKSERERERVCVLIMMGGALCLGRCDCVWHCGTLYSLIYAIPMWHTRIRGCKTGVLYHIFINFGLYILS